MSGDAGPRLGWPIVARDDELRQALAALDPSADFRGAVLYGASGVGKSTLARAVAGSLEAAGRQVRYAVGTETGRAVPLGAFSRAVTVTVTKQPAAMLAAAHAALAEAEDLTVVVDDAQVLDPLSALLVHQLVTEGDARVIATIGPDDGLPDAVSALVTDRRLRSLRIEAFTAAQVEELARAVLGGPVDAGLVDELYRRTGGNLLLLRGLLSAGRESGVLVSSASGWRLHGPLRPGHELDDLLEFRLRSLDSAEREVVEALAVGELLDWEVLRELCDAAAAGRLERRGLVQVYADGSHTLARLNHPIIGDAAIKLAGVVRCRQLNGRLVTILHSRLQSGAEQARLPDARGRIRLAQYVIRSDLEPDLELVIAAAASAVAMSGLDKGEELARFALDRGGGLPAALVLAEALSWQGRGREADAVLAGIEPTGPAEQVRWGCARAANLFWGLGDVDAAQRLLAGIAPAAEAAVLDDVVAALGVSFAFFAGDVSAAIDAGLTICATDTHHRALAWTALTMSTAWAAALVGRFGDEHVAARASRPVAEPGRIGMQPLATGLADVVATLAAGDLPAAEQLADRYSESSAGAPGGDAILEAMRGRVLAARGELGPAAAAFAKAVALMAQGFPPGWLMPVAAWAAQTEGARGTGGGAAELVRLAEQADGPQVAVFRPELELARAWERAAANETTAAQQHAATAAQLARRSGMWMLEIAALHAAVRFGDRARAARLTELAAIVDTPLAAVMAAQARALTGHDGDLLDAAAERFIELGATALAADAAAQAAREHARHGQYSKELGSAGRAHALAARCGLRSPAVVATAHPLPITDREREIAMLAAAGMSNRKIADQLCVSVRTIDGHLYRIFTKLGIERRSQLMSLLAAQPLAD